MSEWGFEAVGEKNTVTISNRTAHWCYEYVGLFNLTDVRNYYSSDVQWITEPFSLVTHSLWVNVYDGFNYPPLVFMELPYGTAGNYGGNTGGVLLRVTPVSGVPGTGYVTTLLEFACAKVGPPPRVRIFQRNPQHPSSETHGIRIWDESGHLLFDSGRKYLWVKGAQPITLRRFMDAGHFPNLLPQYHESINFGFDLANHSVACMAYFGAETHEVNRNYASWAKTFQYNGTSLLATWTPTNGVGSIPTRYSSTVPVQDAIHIPLFDIPAFATVIDNSFYP